jgi:hypothetical protein
MEIFMLNIYLEAESTPNVECIRLDGLNPPTFIVPYEERIAQMTHLIIYFSDFHYCWCVNANTGNDDVPSLLVGL